jgi:hypothetical protein
LNGAPCRIHNPFAFELSRGVNGGAATAEQVKKYFGKLLVGELNRQKSVGSLSFVHYESLAGID